MLSNFNQESQLILLKAREEMLELNHPYIGTEHLLLSILKNKSNTQEKLNEYGITYTNFKKEIIKVIGKGSKQSEFFLHTPLLKKVMENAMLDAKDNNNGEVTLEHLVASLLEEGEGIAIRILIGMNINIDDLYEEFNSKLVHKNKRKKKKLLIEELGINLVEKAKNSSLDPVFERDKEIERLIEILCRRNKNNPLLIGDAGVGKTAIVEALASRINEKNVPQKLQNKKIISLDMATIVSGTKYRGEFEERMQKIIKEISDDGNIILFIDEIHTLVGAGGAEGAIDASNILKPSLARGIIKCIGATTTEEYKKYIEQDKALERRFQKIIIEEPNQEATLNILKHLLPIYEQYHHVKIPPALLKTIVELSNHYIYDRHNPDKVIDILDEACSMVSIKESKQEKGLYQLKKELKEVQKKKNSLIIDNDINSAYQYLKKEIEINHQINELQMIQRDKKKEVTITDIAKVISQKTNIPIYEIEKDTLSNIEKLYTKLNNEIIGQENAIKSLINMTKKMKLGYNNHKVKSYLFIGPTGVGKTKLAKTYAQYLVGDNNLIRLDMSEYSDVTSINKIIGSSPGYVGYQDNYTLLTKLKEKPFSVLLLDEIDKAHPSVLNLLYQILDDGMITDAKNNTINLNHNIIIMTSNIGFEETKVGFNQEVSPNMTSNLKQKFPPSLINRIDNILVFKNINEENITKIIKKKLNSLQDKYKEFKYTNNLIKDIIKESDYQEYGARKAEKIINDKVENIIIDKLLNNKSLTINSLNEYQETTT